MFEEEKIKDLTFEWMESEITKEHHHSQLKTIQLLHALEYCINSSILITNAYSFFFFFLGSRFVHC